jgi:7-carboxy-7-deazaguanine synthase
MLEVAEIFESLQGEGPFMGRPAAFLRLSRCLAPFCHWCDTPQGLSSGKMMTPLQIIEWLESFASRLVVITGGEPFLQWSSGLEQLVAMLSGSGWQIQYETSGKVELPVVCPGSVVCSPKFLDGCWRIIEANIARVEFFKFVVGDADDFAVVADFIDRFSIDKRKVWLMPLGATRAEQIARMGSVWELCVANGLQFSPRLHTLAFDQQQGR